MSRQSLFPNSQPISNIQELDKAIVSSVQRLLTETNQFYSFFGPRNRKVIFSILGIVAIIYCGIEISSKMSSRGNNYAIAIIPITVLCALCFAVMGACRTGQQENAIIKKFLTNIETALDDLEIGEKAQKMGISNLQVEARQYLIWLCFSKLILGKEALKYGDKRMKEKTRDIIVKLQGRTIKWPQEIDDLIDQQLSHNKFTESDYHQIIMRMQQQPAVDEKQMSLRG